MVGVGVLGLGASVAHSVDDQSYASTAASQRPAVWGLVFIVGLVIVAAAIGAALIGRGGPALIALLVAWLAPLVVGWDTGPNWLRSLAIALGALSPLFVAAAARPLLERELSRGLVLTSTALCTGAGLLALLAYEPFLDPRCVADCSKNPWSLTHLTVTLALALGLATVVGAVLGVALVRRAPGDPERAERRVLLAIGATSAATLPGLFWTGLTTSFGWVAVVAVGLGSLAGLVMVDAWPRVARRRRLASLVAVLTAAPAPEDLGESLTAALGRPVEVTYPDPAGPGYVDTTGCPTLPPHGDRLDITSRGAVVAVLTGAGARAAAGDPTRLDLDPALALLVENASVVVGLRAQVSRVRAARADVVAATDAARAGLEHDLHDGTQQLVLALGIDLRLLADSCPPGGPAEERAQAARDEVMAALNEIRAVAHGLHPAPLAQGGLSAALDQLTEQTGVQVSVDGPTDLTPAALMAAYRVIESAAEQVADRGRSELFVRVATRGEAWEVTLHDGSDEALLVGDVADRVAAEGGALVGGPPLTATLPRRTPPS